MFESGLPQVFVSYSKRDNVPHDWLKEFEAYCKFYIRKEYYELRYDEQIEAGDKWLDWIRIAMAKMRVAVLLVGPEFLGSDFILDEELPRLLEEHGEQKRLFILVVRSCAYHHSVLQHFQAFNNPNRPLEQLEVAQRSKIYADLADAIHKAVEIPIGEGEYERDPISVAISKPGEQDRRIEVRRLIKRDSGSPSIQLELSWQTIGDGVEFLLQQLQEHAPEYVPDLCVGINEFGLALAGFLAGAYPKGSIPIVKARNDPSYHRPVIKVGCLPALSKVRNILVVDSELKSGVATRNVVDWLCKRYEKGTNIKIAILAACRVQGEIRAINDLWKQGQVPEDDPKYLPDFLSFISEDLIEPPVKIR